MDESARKCYMNARSYKDRAHKLSRARVWQVLVCCTCIRNNDVDHTSVILFVHTSHKRLSFKNTLLSSSTLLNSDLNSQLWRWSPTQSIPLHLPMARSYDWRTIGTSCTTCRFILDTESANEPYAIVDWISYQIEPNFAQSNSKAKTLEVASE